MGTSPYTVNAATFLISTLFGVYIIIVMLRFLLAWVRADFYNPMSQFLVKATNPVLRPLRRFIPGYGGVDLASVVLMLVLQMVELALILGVLGRAGGFAGLLVWAAAELLQTLVRIFTFSILIEVVLSWVSPGGRHPITMLLYRLNAPLLGPARRMLPPMGGIDFSPVLVLILLQLTSMLLVAPIADLGRGLALG